MTADGRSSRRRGRGRSSCSGRMILLMNIATQLLSVINRHVVTVTAHLGHFMSPILCFMILHSFISVVVWRDKRLRRSRSLPIDDIQSYPPRLSVSFIVLYCNRAKYSKTKYLLQYRLRLRLLQRQRQRQRWRLKLRLGSAQQ